MEYNDEKKQFLLLDISGVLIVNGTPNHELIEYFVSECPADKIVLLTNLDTNAGDILTKRYGIPEFYDEIISAGEAGYAKPNPKIFEEALKRLNANLSEINKLMRWNVDEEAGFMNQSRQQTLNQLPSIFLKLLKTKQLIEESLQRTKASDISSEIKKLEKQMQTPDISPAIEKSLRGNIEIHRKRLDNLSYAKENEMLVEMELQRIENQLHLVREGIALDSSPEGLTSNIDRINNTLGETQDWINNNSDFLRKLSGPPIDNLDLEMDSEPVVPPPSNRESE